MHIWKYGSVSKHRDSPELTNSSYVQSSKVIDPIENVEYLQGGDITPVTDEEMRFLSPGTDVINRLTSSVTLFLH